MGFRKKDARKSDNRSKAKVIMGKPASQLSKEEKKILSARMAEIRSANGGKNTVQNTIPFLCMYKDGVCQVSENFFSLTVQFFDANYSISEFEEQNNIFSKYCDVINLFDNTIKFQLTFENQNRSKEKLVKTVQIPEQDDDFNTLRKEYSEMLTDKLMKGSNGQSARKFLTFGIESTSYKAARAKLMSIKNDVIKGFKAFGVEAEMLDGRQRLEALYYALNPYRNSPFIFDWDSMLRAGMDTKDFICPPSLKFNKADFEIGNAYGAVWGMNILAGELPDEILKDFLEMQNLFCVNIHVDPLDQIDALKFVKKKLTNVEQMKIDEQKKASQSGYDPDILPPAIKMYDVAQTAVDTALAAETGGIKIADTAQREVRNKLKQKYTREAVDDYHRGVFLMGRTAVDAVKGTHNHLKTKKQYKLEKAKFQLKKADNKLYKAKTQKPKMAATKADLRKAKAEYRAKIKPAHGNKLRKAMNKRRLQAYKQTKRELKFERKQIRTESKFRIKEYRNQKKIKKLSDPGLLALKPATYTAGRMKASAWQKAVNEDQDNDFVHAIDSAKRRVVEPAAQKVSKPQRLQKKEKQRDCLNDKKSKSNNRLNRQESKLKDKHDSYKKRKKPKPKKKKGAKDTISAALKAAWKFVKNVYESEVKKFFLCLAIPVIVILLVFAIFTMIFSATSSHSGFTLGTYAAQDYDLSEAEKYYTELAYNLNQKIRKVGSSTDWQSGLAAFGANTGDLEDTPDEWVWGQSSVYDWTPQYDFDTYKLWSFLCAYYYDFDADNDDIYYWEFDGDTEDLLEEIFNDEYEFVYWYDNQSRWEELDNYVYFGGGSSTDGSYYYCEQDASKSDGSWTYKFKPTSYTSELGQYLDGDGYCYLNGNYRVLNANKSYALTGYYVLDNRYYADSAHTKAPFYWIDGDGNFFFRNHDGNNQYRSFYGWTGDDAWFMITEADARAWLGDDDCSALFGYVQKQYWKTECKLYYNVKQNKTFDEVIAEKLGGMSHSDERLQYYSLLIGTDGTASMYGNHQTLHNLLPGATIRDYDLKREFGYEMTGWNTDSDGLYQGIKVYCTNGDKLKAPFKGKITDVDTTDNKITIRKDDVEYWYDGTGGTKRDTEVTIANAKLLSGFSEGDTVNDGQEFAKTTAGNVNFHIYIDTDGYGWDYIDPRLVLY